MFSSHQGNCCLIVGYLSGLIGLSAESVGLFPRTSGSNMLFAGSEGCRDDLW